MIGTLKIPEVDFQERYADFKRKIKDFFKDTDAVANLDSFSDENAEVDHTFAETVDTMMYGAFGKVKAFDEDHRNDFHLEEAVSSENQMITKISNFLSFDSIEKAQTYLPSTFGMENDYFFNALTLFFYALLLVDPKIEARYEVAYMLSQNKVEVGSAGYSEKLKRYLPYYLTFIPMTKKIIIIDPIAGTAETITYDNPVKSLCVVADEIRFCSYGQKIGWVRKDGSLEFYKPYDKGIRDYKAAERRAKRDSGKKAKETTWQTVSLGSYGGSSKYMRVHSLICLMVYELSVMRFALMESNSIYTIDHINSKHACNNVDNLALLTRQHNCSKGDKDISSGFYIDYFQYLSGGSLV